ncbi:hypothetical protein EDD22DRAFT_851488 [Suillus occidentalis]|nr:hypothetical protein EDD22DRAFT_851488 [Suillus occidentalis]
MDEIDSSDIWQQILRLNILDTDSENSSVIGSSGKPAEIAADDVLNLNDDDIATLAAAIDKVEIVDTRGSMDIKPKPKRGRPKKRVIQRCTKLVPTALPDDCTETDPHPNSTLNVPLIRAIISPVPEHVIQHVESVNGNPHIQSWETDEANDMSMAHLKETQTRHPHGRPARKAIIKRPKLKVMESMVKSPIPQQVKSITPRPIICATSNPVQDHHQQAIDDNVMYNPESCDISHIDDKSCTGDGEPVQHSSIMKQPRGRPNRWNVRARARQLMDESKFVANQSENVDDMCMKEHKSHKRGSPSPSETSIHDDEYRPSPPPPPTVHSPSPEVSPDTAVELPPAEIASCAMARPIFWTSVLYTWTMLGSDQWLEATVADFYLAHVWYEMLDKSCMRYVDLHTSMVKDISEEELACFRRWLKDDCTFDDYEGGPTIEMLLAPRDTLPTMTFQAGELHVSTAWVDWVNHGYHITPGSFHIFYQCDPIATMAHIMPIGMTDSHDPSHQVPDRVTGNYSLEWRGSHREGHQTSVTDVEIFSAAELINSANYDPPLHDECRFRCNAFVRGRASNCFGDGPALYLDLERDAVKFSEQEIETSVDIDSIIWTTKEFRCQGSVGIYITPPFQTKPGIFKHNHMYVNITIPQSEEDASTPGGQTEWLSKQFPMSAIPHVCIEHITSASSMLNLYIAFPRMIHQHPMNGRRITLMPKEVLDIFWDRVLLPSIGDCTDISWAPYLKHTLEEARYKARGADGRKGSWGPLKAIPLSDNDFRDVQECMAGCIRDGEGELSMYGLLFFILEGKGIKLLTKDGQRGHVGVSFTPHSPDIPVVGVWRLDALEASFSTGGYKRGEMHHHNTLSRYGALQAEMQQERCQQTHIAFRSTYNLDYESI